METVTIKYFPILTSDSFRDQFLKSAFIDPNMTMNKTTIKLTPVNKLFMRDDSFTPMANIPFFLLNAKLLFEILTFCRIY